jgi:hypothetical protein
MYMVSRSLINISRRLALMGNHQRLRQVRQGGGVGVGVGKRRRKEEGEEDGCPPLTFDILFVSQIRREAAVFYLSNV